MQKLRDLEIMLNESSPLNASPQVSQNHVKEEEDTHILLPLHKHTKPSTSTVLKHILIKIKLRQQTQDIHSSASNTVLEFK